MFNAPGYMERTYIGLPSHNTISFVLLTYLFAPWQSTDTISLSVEGVMIKTFNPSQFFDPPYRFSSRCGKTGTEMSIMGNVRHSGDSLTVRLSFTVNGALGGSVGIRNVDIQLKNSPNPTTSVCALYNAGSGSPYTEADPSCSSQLCPGESYLDSAGQCSGSCDPKCNYCYGSSASECYACEGIIWQSAVFKDGACQGSPSCDYTNCYYCDPSNKCYYCRNGAYLLYDFSCVSTCDASQRLVAEEIGTPPTPGSDSIYRECNSPCQADNSYWYPDKNCHPTCDGPFAPRTVGKAKFCDVSCTGYYYADEGVCRSYCNYPNTVQSGYLVNYCVLGVSQDEQKQVESAQSATSAGSTASAISGGAIGVLSSSDPGALSAGSLVKLLQFLRYLEINYPPKMVLMFKSSTPSAGIINFVPKMPGSLQKEFITDDESLPSVFTKYELNPSFFVPLWSPVITLLIILTVIGLLGFLKSLNKLNTKVKKVVLMADENLRWNFFLLVLSGCYCDIAFYSALQFRALYLYSFASLISFLACIVLNLLTFFVFVLMFHICHHVGSNTGNASQVKENETEGSDSTAVDDKWKSFGILYNGLKKDFYSQHMFMFMVNLRSYFNGALIGYCDDYPIVQTSLLTATSIAVLVYLAYKRPFVQLINFIQQIYLELLCVVVNIIALIFSIWDNNGDLQETSRNKLGNVIIFINIMLSWSSFVFIFAKGCLFLYEFIKAKYYAKSPVKQRVKIKVGRETLQNQSAIQLDQSSIQQDQNLSISASIDDKMAFIEDGVKQEQRKRKIKRPELAQIIAMRHLVQMPSNLSDSGVIQQKATGLDEVEI